MESDYTGSAAYYDLLLEPFLHGIRTHLVAWIREEGIRRVLDMGCGTGKQLSMLPGGTVGVGVDLSTAMLRRAHLQAPGCCVRGDATKLPFGDGSFDLVVTQFALHEKPMDTIVSLLDEARRVLADGGRLVVVDYLVDPFFGERAARVPSGIAQNEPHDNSAFEGWHRHLRLMKARLVGKAIHGIEWVAGGAHYTNYKAWMARGGMDRVIPELGWDETVGFPFHGGMTKMGVYVPTGSRRTE